MAGVVGFVGLDRLSLDMAALLLRAGYRVQAFEVQKLLMGEFLKLGGTECISLMETGKGVAALIVLISHADQINDVIFGHDDALKGLQKDKVIILHSTILPSYIQNLEKKLREDGLATSVVDAYVYKATSDNLNGKVVVMSSGRSDAISKARPFLSAMCEKLYIFEGETGAGSKIKLVTELLEGIHLMAAVEAISLGVHAGIHPWIIYDIISNAAGNSWVFKNYIPQLLRGSVKCHFLNPFILNLGIVLDMAKSLTFPLPLLATAHQQLVLGSSHGNGDDNTPLVQIWDQVYGVNTADAANTELYSPEQLASQIIAKSKTVNRVGFIGLGAMGFGMATHLVKSNFCVLGYDVYRPTLIRFESAGGLIGTSPADVSKDVDVLVVMVTNEAQAESVLYGDLGAVSALPSGASIILSSTVSPAFVSQLERRLQNEGKDLKLVDAPVSGGVKRASMGELTIMAAGSDDALKSSGLVLSVPHMLDNDYTPYSALDIFVKDLGIVARECSTRKVPLHISTMAHQLFLAG
ncbi:Ketose-bisphosphate aldolase class-II family protein isoform 3 [Theobroma cacao]|nr:Ketose-bisphosphate aldolase class-II family protein isoform 3 [Theobroma cacao]